MKICLVMIVKNESHVLARALESVKNLVDFVCIVDTGSYTADLHAMENIIHAAGVPHRFIEMPWRDFAYNRTAAMRYAEIEFPTATHLLMLDADDYVSMYGTPLLVSPDSDDDGYYVDVISQNIAYPRVQLFRADGGWRYRGVVHEYPEYAVEPTIGRAKISVTSTREGARNNDPEKYAKDAALLEAAISNSGESDLLPRYQFYLAQSYENAGDYEKATHWYGVRADNEEGYTEERYVSLYRLAKIAYSGGIELLPISILCREAQKLCPYRREAARFAMKVANEAKDYRRALAIWREYPVLTIPSGLFIEPAVYNWQMYEEAGIAAHYCGEHKLSVSMFAKAIAGFPTVAVDLRRLADNMKFSLDKL